LRRRAKAEILGFVTLTEAWRELGVEPGADAETVRRAYLRLIKTRKPEADPDGFQRARQAYEIARASGEIEALAAGSAWSEAPSQPASASAAGGGGGGAPAGAAPAGEARSHDDVVFEGFAAAWKAVPPVADQYVRIEIAREAVAVLPHDPRAHWLLVTTLSRLGNDVTLADALRAGWRQGWPEFLEALLVRVPASATREEIDAAFASDRPMLRLAAAVAAAAWDGARSARLVVELCRAAAADPLDGNGDRVRELPVGRLLDVILALYAAGALDTAALAHAALRTCLQESGLELELVNGPLGGVWMLAEEIAGLPRDLPQRLRSAFAAATRAGDLASAYYDACLFADGHEVIVDRWAAALRTSAPNVAATLRAALAHQAARKGHQNRAFLVPLRWLVVPLLLIVVRHWSCEPDRPPISSISVGNHYDFPAEAPVGPAGPIIPVGPGLEMLSQAAGELCGPDGSRHGQLLCADIQALVVAFYSRDCSEIPDRIGKVERALREGPPDAAASRFLTRASLSKWQVCARAPAGAEGAGP
jgi:hypothetical protein